MNTDEYEQETADFHVKRKKNTSSVALDVHVLLQQLTLNEPQIMTNVQIIKYTQLWFAQDMNHRADRCHWAPVGELVRSVDDDVGAYVHAAVHLGSSVVTSRQKIYDKLLFCSVSESIAV